MKRLLLALVPALTACERVVDVDVDEGPRRLVVEARLERILGNVTGQQAIRLSTTGSYFSGTLPPAATGATVRVTDDRGQTTTFSESNVPGTYQTSALVVTRDRMYTLRINWEGQRYEGVERTMTVSVIDSLYFAAPKPGRFSGEDGVRATIDTRDPAGEKNFYLWDQFVDGRRMLGPDSTFKMRIIAPDDAVDGKPVLGFQPFEGIGIAVGSSVLVRQVGISEATYRYYFALSDQVGADGSAFSVPPASVRGNVANLTNPLQPALGYFYVSEVAEARGVRAR
ncbi:MAG: DUF4249 domain-containing protein [Gemmatimonadaceae bacterium]|nr:DUF4249 domain-containing protein [Gemmatimonadaceae bacterium]